MKLQLALDTFSLEESLKLVEKVQDYVDIIEVGTPFVMEEGMRAVRKLHEAFPQKEIFADTKIADAGALEATVAFEAGAKYVSVLAVCDLATVASCVETAKNHDGEIVADMICVTDIPKKVAELESVGVNGIAVHTGVDQQKLGRTPLDDLKVMMQLKNIAKVFVAGGIDLQTVAEYQAENPDVLIVGGGIGSAEDPVEAARMIFEKMK